MILCTVEMMKERFCRPVEFVATFEEELGKSFYSVPFGDSEELDRQCSMFSRYVFRKFHGQNNEKTEKPWTTKEVLIFMLNDDISWLKPGTSLCGIIRIYQSLSVETADIERLMSVFSLQDTALNQHSTPSRVEQMVIIQKESTQWQNFDYEAVLTLWQSTGNRKYPLPKVNSGPIPSKGKVIIKSSELIKERHQMRLKVWKSKNMKEQQQYLYDSGSSASEEED